MILFWEILAAKFLKFAFIAGLAAKLEPILCACDGYAVSALQ